MKNKKQDQGNVDLFGNMVTKAKRSMSDYFGIPPFSIFDTTQGPWAKRRSAWHKKIKDQGQARAGVLAGGNETNMLNAVNGGTSILDPVMAEQLVRWFTKEGMKTFDPFAGDTVFGFVSGYLGRPFKGIELRPEQATFNQEQCDREGLPCTYICDNSENMDEHIGYHEMDFVFSCPPYADLEVYSDLKEDLSTMPHRKFFEKYTKILQRTFIKLRDNRFAVIVTSEVRDKEGFYIRLVPRTIDIMVEAGYKFYNEIILVNSPGTLPLRATGQMNATRKVGRRHQNVLVFYKGDPKKINDIYGDIMPKNKHYGS